MTEVVNDAKLEELAGKVVGDIASSLSLFMSYIGDQAGVYTALDGAGRLTVNELADKTGLNRKYLHQWLGSNAAAGYVTYHPDEERFSLSPEQALIFARDGQPACMQGFFQAVVSQYETQAQAVETFKSGKGRPWGDHTNCCFCGTDRFFRPGYAANLVDNWIPALDGVEEKLRAGAKVADIACGHGVVDNFDGRGLSKLNYPRN